MIIYKITNLINRKIYIGQTVNSIEERWTDHKYWAKRGLNIYFYNAIRKYDSENFKLEVLLKCYSQEDLDFFEDYYIVVYDSMNSDKGYNMIRGGKGGISCGKFLKEYWNDPKNKSEILEFRKKHSEFMTEFYKNKENKDNQSDMMKAKWKDLEYKTNQSKLISKGMKDYLKNNPEEKKRTIINLQKILNDPIRKEERIKKQSEGLLKWWSIPENKERQIKALNKPDTKRKRRAYHKKKKQEFEKAKQENDFNNMRYDDLYELAFKCQVYGRGDMCKQELIESLQEVLLN